MALSVYPVLKGLDFNVVKRPTFSNSVESAGSGAEVRLGYWSVPLWEFELNYAYLPDAQLNGTTANDYKTLLGFFLSVQANLTGFALEDPDDNFATNQTLGVGNNTTTSFVFTRIFGLGTNVGLAEPIGQVFTTSPVPKIYVNGVLQVAGYTISTTSPGANSVVFGSAPLAGQIITAEFGYYFYVRFKESQQDFSKFLNQIWEARQVSLRSLRAGS